MTRTAPAAGSRTVGRFQIISTLSNGQFGLVCKAKDPNTGDYVAIKIGSLAVITDPVMLKRFEQEFRSTSNLSHPNIVRALEFGWDNTRPYIVMEYVDGEDMGARIERLGKLPEAEAIDLIAQVAKGLSEAHKSGIIHRDIKPDNILLTADGLAKLADLGLSKDLESNAELTCDDRGLGTPNYIAPEQFADAKHSGVRCDVYGLGATLYAAVTGAMPFAGSSMTAILQAKLSDKLTPPRKLVPTLSEHVDWAIRRAVQADPVRRFPSCADFVTALLTDPKKGSGTHRVGKRNLAARKPAAKVAHPSRERRKAVRYECALPTACTVNLSVHEDALDPGPPWDAQVTDLSVTGVGLLLSRRFEPSSILTVVLTNKAGDFTRTRNVRVMHVVKAVGEAWFVGTELIDRLSREEVRQLL